MLGATDDRQVRRGTDRAEPRPESCHTTFRAGHLRLVEQPTVRGMDERPLDPFDRGRIRGAQQQVDAGPHGRDDVDDLVGTLGERPHVERIGDRHALEAQIAPQQVGHDGPRQRRRQVVATGHGRQRHVRRHRQTRACGERRAERHELARLQGRARGADRGEPVVRIGGRFPRPRGVLHRGRHAGRLEAADHGRPVPRDERRVVAERPDPEGRVRRVRRDDPAPARRRR